MGIVIVTIPGDAHRAFANALHERTGAVDLVIIQRPKSSSIGESISRLAANVGWKNVPRELWYAAHLRLDRRLRDALSHFRHGHVAHEHAYLPPTLEVDSVNGPESREVIARHAPDLLVVWGSAILAPATHAPARRAVNLHFGNAPYYRGALANQHAVLDGAYDRIGATIHYLNGKMDAGDILEIITADQAKPPKDLFHALTSTARERYVDIVARLHAGEELPVIKQEGAEPRIMRLKEWTPSTRYLTGKKVLAWEAMHATRP